MSCGRRAFLARHAREHGPAAGHECLANLVQGTVCKILSKEEIKAHKVRYYLEKRNSEFEPKMAEVLCVYREVEVLKKAPAKGNRRSKPVAIISYDEKPENPGHRNDGARFAAPNPVSTPPLHGIMSTNAMARSACWPGLTCSPARSMRSSETATAATSSLSSLGCSIPHIRPTTTIKLISRQSFRAHLQRDPSWLSTRSADRFELTFTPKHGSWLNLIEGFFSKFAGFRHPSPQGDLETRAQAAHQGWYR